MSKQIGHLNAAEAEAMLAPWSRRAQPIERTEYEARIERARALLCEHGADALLITAGSEPTRLILVAGKPLNEPVAKYGPFVMNTPQQIAEAIHDYQSGKF